MSSAPSVAQNCVNRIRANFPPELLKLDQWVTWRKETRDSKPTKVPYNATSGKHADSGEPTTWSSFARAADAYLTGAYDGVGFVFSEHDPYCGADFDDCIDAAGALDPDKLITIRQLDSYTERSQSGRGVHVIVRAQLPGPGRNNQKLGREIYDRGRFFVVTGDTMDGFPTTIEDRQETVVAYYTDARYFKQKTATKAPPPRQEPTLDDQALLKLMFASRNGAKLQRLWDGSAVDYNGDESARDQALCNALAFWAGKDAARMDRLFRQSGCMRDKWDRAARSGETYGAGTIERAIDATSEVYTPRRPSSNGRRDTATSPDGPPPAEDAAPPADELPTILLNNRQLSDLMTETMVAIAEHSKRSDPLLFVRGGRLVRLAADENGALRTDLITPDALLGIMARVARWVHVTPTKDGGEKVTNVSPPALVSRVLCAAAGWDLPVLEGIAHAPIFDANGILHTETGYNAVTRLYHAGAVRLGDTTPTRANVAAAVALLTDDLFVDFPLDAASRAHAIGLAILPFVRPMIRGATPMHLATAPQHRAGKSLLVESALYPALGRTPDMTPDAGDETEWAKVLTTKLLSSPSVVVLDNLSAELRSPMLATAISEARLTSRILGSNTEVSAPARWVWAATGRNTTLHEELMLRSVLIRLMPKTERPEERSGFKHGNQLEWVAANRDNLVTAIITIVRNWLENANRKPFAGRAKGRFESWVSTMGGILAAAGIEGFLDNEKELRSTSAPEADAFRNFVMAWWETYGSTPVTVSNELFKLASTPDDDKLTPGNDLLGEVLGNAKEHGRKVALGSMLKRYAGRVYSEDSANFQETPRSFQVAMHRELASNKAKQWFLAEISAESPKDSANPTSSRAESRGVSRSLLTPDVDPAISVGAKHVTPKMAESEKTPRDSAVSPEPEDLSPAESAWLDEAEADE